MRILCAVDLLQVALDLARAHAADVKRDHRVVEVRQPALMLADQHWIETQPPVAGNGDPDGPVTGLDMTPHTDVLTGSADRLWPTDRLNPEQEKRWFSNNPSYGFFMG